MLQLTFLYVLDGIKQTIKYLDRLKDNIYFPFGHPTLPLVFYLLVTQSMHYN